MNAQSDDQTRELFASEDLSKILKIEKYGQTNKVVHFKTLEDRDGAMARLPEEAKHRTTEDRSKPLVKIFIPRESNKSFGRDRGGVGTWGSSSRGGTNTGGSGQSGYRSAGGGTGTASDSEGAGRRGGGSGRGGRGAGRGGDGRGPRARGGPRVPGLNKGDGGNGSPAPTPPAPADS